MNARAPPIQYLLRGVINVAYMGFKAENIMDALERENEGEGAGGNNRRRASTGDIAVGYTLH